MLYALCAISTASAQIICDGEPAQPGSVLTLRLRLYNSANVPHGTLDRAMELAQKILSKAGVDACWERGSVNADEARFTDLRGAVPSQRLKADERGYLAVRIIRGEPEHRFPGALGFALPFAQAGPHAIVYYDRIERILPSVPSSVTRILGHALAHEIGHALLETTDHSQDGLMKDRWSKIDFQRTAAGLLAVTLDEARAMQENARRRAEKGMMP
jgi:hypothetical protein